jgi:hypothetical protein
VRVLVALLWLCVCGGQPAAAHAQRALAAASVEARLPSPMLTLRPQAGLEALARNVAAVLELRTGQRVVVGDAPPPGLLEAVPTGHVAFAHRDGAVLLVLGAVGGHSVDANVQLSGDDVDASARAVALALEALRDEATDLGHIPEQRELEPGAGAGEEPGLVAGHLQLPMRDDESSDAAIARSDSFLGSVEPLVYVRAYGGASSASQTLMTGFGTGLGLCVEGYCLVVTGDMPANNGSTDSLDVRYRYPTFTSGFYARLPFFGALTPGASLGFLTRLGHFERDMGLDDSGLDTDLGARGTLELAWEVVPGLDLMTETGVDFTIDRHQLNAGDTVRNRGDQWSPWAQTALRYRP